MSATLRLSTSPLIVTKQVSASNTQRTRLAAYVAQAWMDCLVVFASFAAAEFWRDSTFSLMDLWDVLAIGPAFVVVAFFNRAYSYESMTSARVAISRALLALIVVLAFDLLVNFSLKNSAETSRLVFFVGSALAASLLVAVRIPTIWIVRHVLISRFIRRVLIVDGAHVPAVRGFEIIDAQRSGIVPDVDDPIMLNNFSCLVHGVDRVVVACAPESREAWAIYLKGVGCWGELLIPELQSVAPIHHEPHLGVVGIRVSTNAFDIQSRILKRMLDLAVAVPAIVFVAPLMVLVAIAIKLDSPGPIFFRQRRMGRGNQLFDVFKFRSMSTEQTDAHGARSVSRIDDRVTRVGRIIRATSIDELPQLLNVLNGDMSLVGPRPHALGSLAGQRLFWHVDTRYWLRHAIKPGITGLAQVRGYRGATDHADDLTNRLQSDLDYVTDWSIMRDVSILCRTFLVVVHKNAY